MDATTATFEKRTQISEHSIVSREEWLPLRQELLRKEKELTRLRDRLNAERRELPWVRVEKNYVFNAPGGRVSLRNSLPEGANWSSITSCLDRIGRRVVRAAHLCPIISTARSHTWRRATSRWRWSRGRHLPRSKRSNNAWAGGLI